MIELQGENLSLRQIVPEDYALITQWNFDPEITRYFSPRPSFSEELQKQWFENLLNDKTKLKFMIIPKNKRDAIGMVGLQNINRVHERAEIGISIGDNKWLGKGLGTDAVKTLLSFSFEELKLHQIRAEVFTENTNAIRLFIRCGFKSDGILRHYWKKEGVFRDVQLLSLLKDEFTVK
jgi:UDP-4-amino-4,6-dideoxy-N-acetyl-beta-L-altrosamine N-acetyltransferase